MPGPSLPIIGDAERYDMYEFPHCDMRHEALVRDPSGKPVNGGREFEAQCPQICRQTRPACAHFAQDDDMKSLPDPILADLLFLQERQIDGADALHARYQMLRTTLTNGKTGHAERGLDREMRLARCGTRTGSDVPTSAEAREDAARIIERHRQVVDEMKALVGEIRHALESTVRSSAGSSMMEACDVPLSSPSGSRPTQRSSSEPTPSPTSPAWASSSPQTSRSTTI